MFLSKRFPCIGKASLKMSATVLDDYTMCQHKKCRDITESVRSPWPIWSYGDFPLAFLAVTVNLCCAGLLFFSTSSLSCAERQPRCTTSRVGPERPSHPQEGYDDVSWPRQTPLLPCSRVLRYSTRVCAGKQTVCVFSVLSHFTPFTRISFVSHLCPCPYFQLHKKKQYFPIVLLHNKSFQIAK